MLGEREAAKQLEQKIGGGIHAIGEGKAANRRWEMGMLGEGEAAETEDGDRGMLWEKGKQLTKDGRWDMLAEGEAAQTKEI
jgi:hypothetical protein